MRGQRHWSVTHVSGRTNDVSSETTTRKRREGWGGGGGRASVCVRASLVITVNRHAHKRYAHTSELQTLAHEDMEHVYCITYSSYIKQNKRIFMHIYTQEKDVSQL